MFSTNLFKPSDTSEPVPLIGMDILNEIATRDLHQMFRFAIDGRFQNDHRCIFYQEKYEPGAIKGILDGYAYGLRCIHKRLSIIDIKHIHFSCCNNVKRMKIDNNLGGFRTSWTSNYYLSLYENMSDNGARELIQRYTEIPFVFTNLVQNHLLNIKSQKELNEAWNSYLKTEYRLHIYPFDGDLTSDEIKELNTLYNEHYEPRRDKLLFRGDDYKQDPDIYNYIRVYKEGVKTESSRFIELQKKLEEGIERRLDLILQTMYDELERAATEDEKILAIIKGVKRCLETNPFADGNRRTFCRVILNVLLIQQGFVPTILHNSNHFYGYSFNELLTEVKEGMKKTEELYQNVIAGDAYNKSIVEKSISQDFALSKKQQAYFDLIKEFFSSYAEENIEKNEQAMQLK